MNCVPKKFALATASAALCFSGCVATGTGSRTMFRATTADSHALQLLPHLLVPPETTAENRILLLGPGGEVAWPTESRLRWFKRAFDSHLFAKYGTTTPETARLSIEVRDFGTIPAMSSALQAAAMGEVAKIMMDGTLDVSQKLEKRDLLLAQMINSPQAFEMKTRNHITSEGREVYYYYPHVELDFSSGLLSPSVLDRFSELVLVVDLPESIFSRGVRFVNFAPKGADIVEYTRGTFKQESQAQAKATYGLARSAKSTTKDGDNTSEVSASPSFGGEISYTHSEAFERDLKDAIERRSASILNDGKTFVATFRSMREVRIAGTYTFELLLEVPSIVESAGGNLYESVPVTREITPHIVLAGVVRHLYQRGYTGFFQQVPEAENDNVFEQVVVRPILNRKLWSFNNESAIGRDVLQSGTSVTVNIVSNTDDARFVLRDAGGRILGNGAGKTGKIDVATENLQTPLNVELRFLDVPRISQDGSTVTLRVVQQPPNVSLTPRQTGSVDFVGSYQAQP